MTMRPGWGVSLRPSAISASLLLALSAFLLSACGQQEQEPVGLEVTPTVVPSDITVRPTDVRLKAGDSVQLSAQVNDGAGQPIGGAPLVFKTSDPSMLRLTQRGALTAVGAAGEATVEVSSGTLTKSLPVTVVPASPARVVVLAGARQQAAVGKSLPNLISVRINDAFGNAVAGVPVRFELESGQGTIQPATATSDADGKSSAAWTLGHGVGSQVARVSIDGEDAATEVIATATPGPPEQLLKVGDDQTSVIAGSTVTLRAQVQDAFGNPAPDSQVEWQVAEGPAKLAAETSTADASGLVEMELTTGPKVGRANATAVLAGDGPTTGKRKPIKFTVDTIHGPAASLTIHAGNDQKAKADSAAKVPPAVLVLDANGNPVAGAVVQFAIVAGGGTGDSPSQATNNDGIAHR
ncbi:MAG: Ig-like domain-containing protein [Gammaproteobacteria bacterium]